MDEGPNIQQESYSIDGDIFNLQYFNTYQYSDDVVADGVTYSETTDFVFSDSAQAVSKKTLSDRFASMMSKIPWELILIVYLVISGIIVLILLGIYIYYFVKLTKLRKQEDLKLKQEIAVRLASQASEPIGINQRWNTVIALISSNKDSDWRLAIIEADAMLEALLLQLGYEGNSIGQRLQGIQIRHFPKLNQAWTAHIVRNRIAHQASLFALSKSDAVRTIKLYEEVFRDANYIA